MESLARLGRTAIQAGRDRRAKDVILSLYLWATEKLQQLKQQAQDDDDADVQTVADEAREQPAIDTSWAMSRRTRRRVAGRASATNDCGRSPIMCGRGCS
jgi:hypothetical protein